MSCESSASRRFTRHIKPYFLKKSRKVSQQFSSAAVVIGALRDNANEDVERSS